MRGLPGSTESARCDIEGEIPKFCASQEHRSAPSGIRWSPSIKIWQIDMASASLGHAELDYDEKIRRHQETLEKTEKILEIYTSFKREDMKFASASW